METIWKFKLSAVDRNHFSIPNHAKFLHAGEQAGQMCMWFLVDPDAPSKDRYFRILPTGGKCDPPTMKFVATVGMWNMQCVWHIFEEFSK